MTAPLPTSELTSRPAGQSFGAATLLERLPEPFYKDESVTIYCADCLTLLPLLVANVVLTSPPYNIGVNRVYKGGKRGEDWARYDKTNDEIQNYDCFVIAVLALCIRASNRVFWNMQMCSENKRIQSQLPAIFAPYFKERFVWTKRGQPAMEAGVVNSEYEDVLVFEKSEPDKRKFYGHDWRGLWSNVIEVSANGGNEYAKDHKGAFPLEFATRIVEPFTVKSDIILDPFMGTGTVLRAAKDLGRKSIGIEISENYCEIAAQRMAQTCLAL